LSDDETEEFKSETTTDRAIEGLFKFKDNEDFDTKTELSQNQIIDIAKASAYAEIFDLEILDKFIKSFKTHMISKDRKGRIEVIQALTSSIEHTETEENKSVGNRLKQMFSL